MSHWTIHVRPLPSDVPEEIRVRRALKDMLRRHHLRVLEVQKTPKDPASEQDVGTPEQEPDQ